MRKFPIVALFVACTLPVCVEQSGAQRGGASRTGGGVAHFSNPAAPSGVAKSGVAESGSLAGGRLASRADLAAFRRFYRGGPYADLLSSVAAFSDYTGDPADYGYPSSQPNLFLMPAPPSAAMIEEPPHTTVQPLTIELRGDRYVRVTNDGETSAIDAASSAKQPEPAASSRNHRAAPAQPAAASTGKGSASDTTVRAFRELPPVVLIFRDGHTENVRDYAITDGRLYARGDYYTEGYWTKTIDLAGLNVPATISSNAERGVKFALPGGPNEVITRP